VLRNPSPKISRPFFVAIVIQSFQNRVLWIGVSDVNVIFIDGWCARSETVSTVDSVNGLLKVFTPNLFPLGAVKALKRKLARFLIAARHKKSVMPDNGRA
jgi:hypothetical protein